MANKESETVSEVTIRKAVNEDLDQLVAMQTAMIQLDQELRPDESRYEQMEGANEIWRQFAEKKLMMKILSFLLLNPTGLLSVMLCAGLMKDLRFSPNKNMVILLTVLF